MGIAALLLVGLAIVVFSEDWREMAFPLTLMAFLVGIQGVAGGYADMHNKHREHYNNAVSELKDNLANDGFKVVSGTPELHPNTQSSMLLSYEGKNFDCTMFSPEDINTNIVFSCGEAKLTLTEVKNKR